MGVAACPSIFGIVNAGEYSEKVQTNVLTGEVTPSLPVLNQINMFSVTFPVYLCVILLITVDHITIN